MTDATAAPAPVDNLIQNLRRMTEQLLVESLPWRPGTIGLPSRACLIEFRARVLRLDEQLSTHKDRSSRPWAAFDRVKSKFPEWQLDALITGWVDSFSAIPISPRQSWSERLTAERTGQNPDVRLLLDELGNCRLPTVDLIRRLHAHWPNLFRLAGEEFRSRYHRANFSPLSIMSDPQAVKSELFARWALINELLAQQADWNSRFERFDWFPAWVAAWQNDALTAKIRGHLPQNPQTNPAELKEIRARVAGRRRVERHRGSGNFQKGDILRPEDLANMLRLAVDPVATFVVSRMSAQSRQDLASLGSESPCPRQLESTLLQELTRLCYGPCIYEPQRFGHVPLRPETKRRLSSREIQSPDYQTIKPGTIEDASAVAAALKSPTTNARDFLWERLTARTREALDDWDGKSDLPMRTKRAMLSDLNSIILGPSIWDEARFAEVVIPFHVRCWLDCDLSGPQVAQLNLLLLEQILPLHRSNGYLQTPLPNAVTFRNSLFRLNRVLIEDAFAGYIRATAGW